MQQNQNVRQAEEPVEPGLHLGAQLLGQDDADLRRVEDKRDIRRNYLSCMQKGDGKMLHT